MFYRRSGRVFFLCPKPDRHTVARLHAAISPAHVEVVRAGTNAFDVTARMIVGTKSLAKTASKRRLCSDRMCQVVLLKANALQFAIASEEIEVHSYATMLPRTESVHRPDFFLLTERTIDCCKYFIFHQQHLISRISEAQKDAWLSQSCLDFTSRLLEADDNFPISQIPMIASSDSISGKWTLEASSISHLRHDAVLIITSKWPPQACTRAKHCG